MTLVTDKEVPPEQLPGYPVYEAMAEAMLSWLEPTVQDLRPMCPALGAFVFRRADGLYIQAIIDSPQSAWDYAERYEIKVAAFYQGIVWRLCS